MKTDNTVQHTQGEWMILKTSNPHLEVASSEGIILELFGTTATQKANAERIVKCINTHDDLINALKECAREFQCYDMQKETTILIDKINKLINR